jgi:RecJ-like exonuclease
MAEREIKMTTLTIQNEATIQSEGKKRNRNAKPVLCIETGEVYNSVADAAEANGAHPNAMSAHLRGRLKTLHKKHFIFMSKATENLDPIMSHIRITSEHLAELEFKAKAYDAIMAKQYEKEKKQQRIDMLVTKKAKIEERKTRREERVKKDAELMLEIEAEIKSLEEELIA